MLHIKLEIFVWGLKTAIGYWKIGNFYWILFGPNGVWGTNQCEGNFRIESFNAYSPNVARVEKVWDFLTEPRFQVDPWKVWDNLQVNFKHFYENQCESPQIIP